MELMMKATAEAAKRVLKGRWMVIWVSLLIMACSGGTYVFGIYSETVKRSLGYDQKTLQTLAFFKDLGGNIGLISGLLNEVAPSWIVLAVGAVMNLSGYLMAWLSVTHRLAAPKPWQLYLYVCMGSTSQNFANTGSLVTCVKNFPQSRGVVLGILKGYVGLSGAIFTQIFHAVYGPNARNAAGMILLLAILPCAVSLAVMACVRPTKLVDEKNELGRFYQFLYIALSLAAFLLVLTVVENQCMHFPAVGFQLVVAAVAVFFLFNLAVVVKAELDNMNTPKCPETPLKNDIPLPSQLKNDLPALPQAEGNVPSPPKSGFMSPRQLKSSLSIFEWLKPPARGEDHTIPQTLVSIDMWILFFATTCGVGSTLTAIDNMGQIGRSLGYTPQNITTFVALIGIWNFLGRVMSGFLSEMLLLKYKFPRPLVMTVALALSCVGHFLIAWGFRGSLYPASLIIGLCFGAHWPVMYAVISELFGLKYYATLYNVGTAASPFGFYLLSVRVAGSLYDRAAARQGGKGAVSCVGEECFRTTFLIMCGVCAAGALVSLLLVARTREFYRGDIYARHRAQVAEQQQRELELEKSVT